MYWLDAMVLQFVIVSLSGWGLLLFSGYKFFTRGKGKKEEVFSTFLCFEYHLLYFAYGVEGV